MPHPISPGSSRGFEEVQMPDVPFDAHPGPLLKDFTGDVYAEGDVGLPNRVVE
jgi:hypothetical protein